MPIPDWLTYVEHTADEGIEVRAPELAVLYERAAWGMFSLLTDPDAVKPVLEERVEVEAEDPEELLVRWLSELNVRHQLGHRLFGEFHVREVAPDRLRASIRGEDLDPERHQLYTEIKAVTFCGLRVQRVAESWIARVVFDM